MSAVVTSAPSTKRTLHCAVDDWDFDPRYTAGVCPICGWGPGPAPPSTLQQLAARVPWDYVLLAVLAVSLIIIGVLVGRAAGVNLLPS